MAFMGLVQSSSRPIEEEEEEVPVAQSKKSKKSKKRPKRCVCCVCRKTHIHTYVNIFELPVLPVCVTEVTPSLMVVLRVLRYQTREILIQICYPLPNGGFELPVLPVCVTPSLMVVLRYQTREILIQICYPLPNGGFDSFELPFLNSLVIGSVCVTTENNCVCVCVLPVCVCYLCVCVYPSIFLHYSSIIDKYYMLDYSSI